MATIYEGTFRCYKDSHISSESFSIEEHSDLKFLKNKNEYKVTIELIEY